MSRATRAEPVAAGGRAARSGRELWRFRALLRLVMASQLRVRYRGLAIGFLWTLLQPLLMLAVLLCVFSWVVRLELPHYWAFLLSGFFAWSFLSQTLSSAATLLHEHTSLIRGAAFPLEILVFGGVLARGVEFCAELSVVACALALFLHGAVPPSFALLPLLVGLQLLLTCGLALPLCVLGVFVRDVRQGVPIALTALFYLSPVFYPDALVPPAVRWLYLLNPIAGLLALYQRCLYEGVTPPLPMLLGVAALCAGLFGLGYALFLRYQRLVPELL
jgi:lipopolysaccharide transport system permease protein